jgi:5'-nucleotidase
MTADAREMGRIQLNLNPRTGRVENIDWQVIKVNSTTAEVDPEFTAAMSKYDGMLKDLAVRIGSTSVPLDADSKGNRTRETNVADFLADAMRQAVGADATLLNGGSIRADITFEPGELTRRDIASISPFGDPIYKLQMKGSVLRAALEHGLARSAEDGEPGRFPQVSGMRYKFDATRPAGSRLLEVTIGGVALDDNRDYTLAVTKFVSEGGDGYAMFKPLIPMNKSDAPTVPDVLRNAITSGSPIAPKVDGRIERVDAKGSEQKDPCAPK